MNTFGWNSLIFICFLVTFIPSLVVADEVYIWIDDRGVSNITSFPPDKAAKIIGKQTYTPDSPEEIRRYEELQKLKQEINEQRSNARRQMNELEMKYEKAREKTREKIRQHIEDMEVYKDRYQRYERDARDESSRLFWKDEIRKLDRAINDSKESLYKN